MKLFSRSDINDVLIALKVDIKCLRFARPIDNGRRYKLFSRPLKALELNWITEKLISNFPDLTYGQIAHELSVLVNQNV
jgi:hypothetical protein